jgi:hypothetical protein
MLLIPIMRRRSLDPLTVSIRERFLHTPQLDLDTVKHPIDFTTKNSNTDDSEPPLSGDPFVTPDRSVFDIRIKRVITDPDYVSSHQTQTNTSHSSQSNDNNNYSQRPTSNNDRSSSGSKNDRSRYGTSFSHFHEIGSIDLSSPNRLMNQMNSNTFGDISSSSLPPLFPSSAGSNKMNSPKKEIALTSFNQQQQSDGDGSGSEEEYDRRKKRMGETPEKSKGVVEIYFNGILSFLFVILAKYCLFTFFTFFFLL